MINALLIPRLDYRELRRAGYSPERLRSLEFWHWYIHAYHLTPTCGILAENTCSLTSQKGGLMAEKPTMAEWITTSQGFVESASVTWIDSNLDRIRITELLPKGDTQARDETLVRLLEEGAPPIDAKGVQDLGKPRWYRE